MDFKSEFENDYLRLFQAHNSDFEKLYSIANDPNIWKQHPENDRWKREKFSIFFKNGLLNDFGLLIIYDKRTNDFIGSTRYYSYDVNVHRGLILRCLTENLPILDRYLLLLQFKLSLYSLY